MVLFWSFCERGEGLWSWVVLGLVGLLGFRSFGFSGGVVSFL